MHVGPEGSRHFALRAGPDGASPTPSFGLGLHHVGGDAESGFGADAGDGLAFAVPEHGLQLDVKGRALVAYEASSLREWGANAAFSWDPQPSTVGGLSLSLNQPRGAAPSGRLDVPLGRVWRDNHDDSDAYPV
ncbi:MAG: hypothetical protein OXI81_15450 [Paracoccaceae bacterium]|nr:hypothetical protein [Paracoccaceae bacterium]MDE2915118.1 hypothetical protein [Paracoccaceae bacterium]